METRTIADKKERFRDITSLHLERLYATARRLVADDAEDAVQETLMKAYQALDQLHDDGAARPWLISILVNCCRDRGRARSRQPQEVNLDDVDEFSLFRKIAHEDPFPYSDSLHLDFLERFGTDDVRSVLLSLAEIYRVPLVLVYMDGFSTKEVAKVVDAPLGTVLARLHRGRKLFERKLWDHAESNGLLKERVP